MSEASSRLDRRGGGGQLNSDDISPCLSGNGDMNIVVNVVMVAQIENAPLQWVKLKGACLVGIKSIRRE